MLLARAWFYSTCMQTGKQIETPHRTKTRHPVKSHHLSSFGILNRNGLEIANNIDSPINEEEKDNKLAEFSDWSMPEQRTGYIQSKLHDFF